MNTKKISYQFSTSFGVGSSKFLPGTLASLITLPIVWVIKNFFSLEFFLAIIILPSFSIYFFYKEDNFQWIDWFFTNAIYLITIFLSFKANKGSRGDNFIERVFSIEMILVIRYFVFFSIPYEIFHLAFLEETAYSDIGNLLSSPIFAS